MAEHWSSLWDWRKKWWTRCTFSFVLESIDSSMSITTSDSSWQKLHRFLSPSDIHAMSLRNLLHETWKVNRIFWEIHANGNCPHSIDRYAISSSSSSKCLSFFMQTVNFSFTSWDDHWWSFWLYAVLENSKIYRKIRIVYQKY